MDNCYLCVLLLVVISGNIVDGLYRANLPPANQKRALPNVFESENHLNPSYETDVYAMFVPPIRKTVQHIATIPDEYERIPPEQNGPASGDFGNLVKVEDLDRKQMLRYPWEEAVERSHHLDDVEPILSPIQMY
ncbi:hypothetical protein T265_06136 [Opisthorchis viverrini]|uniref:Uncharacterized protein n=1 Tax=Opisthorchis viverrini TaxID=6198 RepID=A0A074ZH73_OPIVI|nr:hypothetical protein T265_06136 [Opisthorchis viverrini]KER26631.1 hypothetical protein T265_06136 [Opisthorchis viverrini]